jgi:hypothetical protein
MNIILIGCERLSRERERVVQKDDSTIMPVALTIRVSITE